jgi:ATP-binding cassette, subfamily B, bacterial
VRLFSRDTKVEALRRTPLFAGLSRGEIALIEDIPRTATVTAKTPLRFFVLTRQSFWSMVERMPAVERKVLRALARRVVSNDPTLAQPDA